MPDNSDAVASRAAALSLADRIGFLLGGRGSPSWSRRGVRGRRMNGALDPTATGGGGRPGGGPGEEGGCAQAAKAAAVRATLATELPGPVKLRAGANGTDAEEELARLCAGDPPPP